MAFLNIRKKVDKTHHSIMYVKGKDEDVTNVYEKVKKYIDFEENYILSDTIIDENIIFTTEVEEWEVYDVFIDDFWPLTIGDKAILTSFIDKRGNFQTLDYKGIIMLNEYRKPEFLVLEAEEVKEHVKDAIKRVGKHYKTFKKGDIIDADTINSNIFEANFLLIGRAEECDTMQIVE